ncbi:MAG TPA: right-handed parallel beta-helix repeat-containing protein [Polyangia bacterium]|nr:right-handed parallel beta-helix repeat-containing protein [Polyangia bacterium]
MDDAPIPSLSKVATVRHATMVALGVALSLWIGGCGGMGGSSSSGGSDGSASGGTSGTATGGQGVTGKGGSGGGTSTGGATGTGGATNSGGVTGTGGVPGTGGAAGKGGTAGTGNSGAGGMTSSTGGNGTAGQPGTGGTISSGTFYVSPTGTGTSCTSDAPCSITQAQTVVRSAAPTMTSDLVVQLADGTYRLTAPLMFTAADSGMNGHTITWQATTGAHPVLSGGKSITGWAVSDSSKNIWKASAPGSFATRQLYVGGMIATRARSSSISRSNMTFTSNGWTFSTSSLSYLNNLANPARAELNIIGSWTNRYSLIQSVKNNVVTMAQPTWDENTWGYDTVQSPYRQGPIYAENDYTLLDQPGEWYQDTTAGVLYYIPTAGQDLTKVDVELPQLQFLMAVGAACPSAPTGGGACVQPAAGNPTQAVAYAAPASGDPYAQPAHDIVFSGLTFSHTSWLDPNTDGFADQQTGGYVVGPRSNYPGGGQTPMFEATRPHWLQMPAAVQVSAAKNISFVGDRFVDLGQVGLGIGNDANAHASGVGLGANGVNVTGCVFSQIAGGGVVIGGIQAWAHHPCGDKVCASTDPGANLINQSVTVKDNLVHDIGIDYRDFAGVMFTYAASVVVSHNEIYNVPYSGMNSGLGWGTNDAGGNNDYKTRAAGDLYLYQPLYANPTTAKNNTVSANYVHQAMLQMNDGGCHYNLGFQPGTVVTQNYCEGKGSGLSGTYWGEYNDEGSAYITETKNVYANFGAYVTANANAANNTGHITFTNNWGSSASPGLNGPGNTVSGNIQISGDNFPADAQTIVTAAGLESAYANLKTNP